MPLGTLSLRILITILTVSWLVPTAEAQRLRHGRGTYYLHVPPKIDKPSLLVWLHPSAGGAKPEFDFWRKQSQAFGDDGNSILVSPQAIEGAWSLRADEPFIKEVVRKIIKKYDVDPDKVILGGHSAGATFTYKLGLRNQDLFQALFPNAGRLEGRRQLPPDPQGSPLIYIFHSENDDVIPFSQGESARDALRKAGYPVSFYSAQIQHNVGGPTLTLFAAIDRVLQQLEPRIVRLYGGLEGIKVLAQPQSVQCFKIRDVAAGDDANTGPVQDSAMIGEAKPVAGDSFATLLNALVAAEGYVPGAIEMAGEGPFDVYRLAGPEAKLEIILGTQGEWMAVYLDDHRVGTAMLEGPSSQLSDLAHEMISGEVSSTAADE